MADTVKVTDSQNGNAGTQRCLVSNATEAKASVAPDALFGAHTHLPILRPPRLSHHMSLAEASEARKARLLALRKRRAGENEDGAGYVFIRLFRYLSG